MNDLSFDDPRVAEMVELSAPLVDDPVSWSDLSLEQENAFRMLLPQEGFGFNPVQCHFIRLWWLPVNEVTLDEINQKCPSNFIIPGIKDINDQIWISADLLSDAIDDGPLKSTWDIISNIPMNYKPDQFWITEEENIEL